MKTKEEAEKKATSFLIDLPSEWVSFTYEVETDMEEELWQFVLKKGPLTLLPKENATKWVCRIGSENGKMSGPWETKDECVTINEALKQEAESLQAYTQKNIHLLANVVTALQGTGV